MGLPTWMIPSARLLHNFNVIRWQKILESIVILRNQCVWSLIDQNVLRLCLAVEFYMPNENREPRIKIGPGLYRFVWWPYCWLTMWRPGNLTSLCLSLHIYKMSGTVVRAEWLKMWKVPRGQPTIQLMLCVSKGVGQGNEGLHGGWIWNIRPKSYHHRSKRKSSRY